MSIKQSLFSQSINFLTVSCQKIGHLICFVLQVSRFFFKTISYIGIFYTVLVLIYRKNLVGKINIYNQQLNNWQKIVRKLIDRAERLGFRNLNIGSYTNTCHKFCDNSSSTKFGCNMYVIDIESIRNLNTGSCMP